MIKSEQKIKYKSNSITEEVLVKGFEAIRSLLSDCFSLNDTLGDSLSIQVLHSVYRTITNTKKERIIN